MLSPEGAQDQRNCCGNDVNTPVQQPKQENEQRMHEVILRIIQEQFRLQQIRIERMRKKREEEKKIVASFSLRWVKNKACLCLHLFKNQPQPGAQIVVHQTPRRHQQILTKIKKS